MIMYASELSFSTQALVESWLVRSFREGRSLQFAGRLLLYPTSGD